MVLRPFYKGESPAIAREAMCTSKYRIYNFKIQPCYIQLTIESSKGIRISSFVAAVYSSKNEKEETLR